MISSIFFIIISVIYNLIIMFMSLSKSNENTDEIKVFRRLLFINLIGLFLELFNQFTIKVLKPDNIITIISGKVYLSYFIVFIGIFFKYFLTISFNKDDYKKHKIISSIFVLFTIIISIIVVCSKTLEFNTKLNYFIHGEALETTYIITSIYLILIIFLYVIRYNKINKKKFIPCLLYIVFGFLISLIQKYIPSITLTVSMHTIILCIMYITVENPEEKLLQKVNFAKLLIEKSNQNKKEILDSISKDIRRPLNSIIGFSEDIKSQKIDDSINEDITYILDEANNILDLIDNIKANNIYELSKLDLDTNPYNPRKEINYIVKSLTNKIGDRSIEFIVNIDENIPSSLIGDKSYLKEIINNLLTNSIKNTIKGKIELSIKHMIKDNTCMILIIVSDNNSKYSKEEINNIYKVVNDENINEHILLLSLTENIVKLLNGKLDIITDNNKFIVSALIPQEIDNNVENDEALNYSNLKVLVVDDDNLNIKVFKRALKEVNIFIDEATSGIDAIELAKTNNYDLILMDIMMPKLSGASTLKKLKEDANFKTPVIALTADANKGAKTKYINQGFIDYLPKPYNKKQIISKINKVLKKED